MSDLLSSSPLKSYLKKTGITEGGNDAHFFLFFSSYTNRILLHSCHSTPLCIHNNCIHKDTEIDIERSTEQQCCQSPGIFVTFVWFQYLMRRATDIVAVYGFPAFRVQCQVYVTAALSDWTGHYHFSFLLFVCVMVNASVWASSVIKIIFLMLNYNYCCHWWILKCTVLHKKTGKIVKEIIVFWLRCQITVSYLHSWMETWAIVVEFKAELTSNFWEKASGLAEMVHLFVNSLLTV